MNPNVFHSASSLHDKIAEKEEAFQAALDENKDYYLIKNLKAAIDTLKKELRQIETAFHEEFKDRLL
jgi:hypothetical protein